MPSAKSAPVRPASTLADATAKTRSLIEDLQARLAGEARSEPAPMVSAAGAISLAPAISPSVAATPARREETEEDLERQLQAYFEQTAGVPTSAAATMAIAPRPSSLDEIRNRVIEGVVDRIFAEWSRPDGAVGAALRGEVIDRLTKRVLEMMEKADAARAR